MAGGLLGMVVLIVISLCGIDDLPVWTEVPAVIVSVQAGFSIAMGYLLSRELGPLNDGIGPTHADVAFALYGAITLPGVALFVVTMSVASLMQ